VVFIGRFAGGFIEFVWLHKLDSAQFKGDGELDRNQQKNFLIV
jgi:hypothetical protein